MLRHKRHDETKEERGQLLGIHINTGRHRDDEQLVLLILEEEVFGVAFVGVSRERALARSLSTVTERGSYMCCGGRLREAWARMGLVLVSNALARVKWWWNAFRGGMGISNGVIGRSAAGRQQVGSRSAAGQRRPNLGCRI
ncbi:hypothetical protein ACHAWX_000378 [Stephanocyclus meneghinianus]